MAAGNPIVPGQAGSIETQVEPKQNAKSKRKAEVSSGSNCYSKTNVEVLSVHQRKKSKGKGLPDSEVDSSNICVEQEISICDERVAGVYFYPRSGGFLCISLSL